MKSTKKIAVLLTCFNRREKTLRCLHSLYEGTLQNEYQFEIFLVDDGSTDGTGVAVLKEFPDVKVIQGTGNLFWNRGMHLAWMTAVKNAIYDFYLWLNDDVVLLPNALQEVFTTYEQRPESIIVGTMASSKGEITYGAYGSSEQKLIPNGLAQGCIKFNGNLVLIPKSAYERIGILDPKFPHAIGDFDYSLRATKAGIKSYITPNVSGICEEHKHLPLWCLPETPLKKRLKTLYSPLGNAHPRYFFYFEKRHYGLITAIKHYLTIHLRAIFPQLWK